MQHGHDRGWCHYFHSSSMAGKLCAGYFETVSYFVDSACPKIKLTLLWTTTCTVGGLEALLVVWLVVSL